MSLCYRTTPRLLTACTSEMSAVCNFSSLYNSAAAVFGFFTSPCSHGTQSVNLQQTPCAFYPQCIVGGGAPDCSMRIRAMAPLGQRRPPPILGSCLEMSNVLQACLVLIISSCVCD